MENEPKRPKYYHISDHLANERTFLAWLRTSLGLIAFGFVIERFILFSNHFQQWLHSIYPKEVEIYDPHQNMQIKIAATFLIACGSFLSVLAFYKYMRLEQQINNETYSPSYWLEWTLTLLLFLCGVVLMLYLTFS